ncbi:MAG: Cache 3/Cache 2 fusion domain-containing protein, partial [Alphaproteobacteria bacterium]|nr:Cache 3/Cache 2 fusion domain-containing protein [Alphaproteobacteria bacterium]
MRLEAPIPAEALEAISAPFAAGAPYPLDAPVLQPLGLLLDLAGEMLRERLFVVQTAEAGPESCLRTDFTVSALMAHIESGREKGRYFYRGHVFRVAPHGSDRAEEFPQVGVETFEPGDPVVADARIAAEAWRAARAGGRRDLSLLLGDVSLFGAVVDALALPAPLSARLKRAASSPRKLRAELQAAVNGERPPTGSGGRLGALMSGLNEAEAVAALEEIWELAGVEPVGGRSASEIVHRLAERAALAQAPRLSPSQADLFGAYMAITGAPDAALDEVQSLVGGTATIFQRMNEQGDMLRVATNVQTSDGKRAVGTYIPVTMPDGTPNPVVATVLTGKTYHGDAYVVNAWYDTAYEPILNDAGQVIGMLYVG